MQVETGNDYPLGAVFDGEGTNFALFSAHAERVELCLYDADGRQQTARVDLPARTHDVWHGYLPGVQAGAAYGYRVHGPWEPHAGDRFNPHKLLLDPYARAFAGEFTWHPSHFGFDRGHAAQDLEIDRSDNADYMPKAVVGTRQAALQVSRRALTPWHETVIYEVHVRGMTMRHPRVPEALRGSFAGLSQPAVIDYIKSLGVTSVELLPVHSFVDENFLVQRGLRNYWGYNTLNFFTPHPAYCAGGGSAVFRECVDRFHDAGLEIILDVVYNHTAEGNHLGPSLSFRGIDNRSYYRLLSTDRRLYVNDSGCGNTLDLDHPRVMQLVLDSLRYWAGELGVDGFRFDLAPVLGRDERGFHADAPLFRALAQDPVLAGCKLIAEPWDLGPDGYRLGQFPPGFAEWNDRFRDTVRRFWRGDSGQLPELARRLHGSGDIFEHHHRKPYASINFVTSHDGFTLRDLVSYARRDNHANREDNNDGHRENLSANYGAEGPTDEAAIDDLRWRQQRNFLATLMLAQGVPMLQAGDEFGRSQQGNNNAYCQDNPLTWIDWAALDERGEALCGFTRRLLELRRSYRVLQADQFRHDAEDPNDDSIRWINSDGKPMREAHWHERDNRVLGYLLREIDGNGSARRLLVLFNASPETQRFVLPPGDGGWRLLLDTLDAHPASERESALADKPRRLAPRSIQIFTGPGEETAIHE
jgi:glycogen operon protein